MIKKLGIALTVLIFVTTLVVMALIGSLSLSDPYSILLNQPIADGTDNYTRQLIGNVPVEISPGHQSSQQTSQPDFSLWQGILSIITTPAKLFGWLGISLALSGLGLLGLNVYKEDILLLFGETYTIDRKGTYGTARWMQPHEVKKVFSFDKKGYLLGKYKGKYICLPHSSQVYNKHVLVIGTSGSGKSTRYVLPNIVTLSDLGASMVLTDTKGELYKLTAKYLEKKGYEVKAFNLVNLACSDRWNPLDVIEEDLDAQVLAQVVIDNTEGKKDIQFWSNAEMNLLKALVLYVKENYEKEYQNMGSMYKLLTTCSTQKLDKMFSHISNDRASKMAYNLYSQAPDNVRGGIVIGLGTRLQIFQERLVRKMTEVSDIDLYAPKLRKCAYFCIIPDTHVAFNFLANLFFSFLFIKLVKITDMTDDPEIKNRDVFFILDEFPNIGKLPDFSKKVATVRSRRLHISMVIQDIKQLETNYPNNEWNTIIGNCDTKLFLGCNEDETAEYISELLGIQSIRTWSTSRGGAFDEMWIIDKYTHSVGRRPLLTPDEVRRFDINKSIIFLRGQYPLIVDKVPYTELVKEDELEPVSIVPKDWSREEEEQTVNVEQNKPDMVTPDTAAGDVYNPSQEELAQKEPVATTGVNHQFDNKTETDSNTHPVRAVGIDNNEEYWF